MNDNKSKEFFFEGNSDNLSSERLTRINNLLKKIDELRIDKDISYKQLEREIGFANGYFGKLKKRESYPTISKIDALADYFHVTRDYFISTEEPTGSGIKIPLLSNISSEVPLDSTEYNIGYEEIPSSLASTGKLYALKFKGDYMSPYICDGDRLIFRQQDDVEEGMIAIFVTNKLGAQCRMYFTSSTGMMFVPKNPGYDAMFFTPEDVKSKNVRIIGKVVEIRRAL